MHIKTEKLFTKHWIKKIKVDVKIKTINHDYVIFECHPSIFKKILYTKLAILKKSQKPAKMQKIQIVNVIQLKVCLTK